MHSALLSGVVHLLAGVYNPGSGKAPPAAVAEKLRMLMDWAAWTATSVCVIGVFAAGGRMALNHRRGEGGEHATGLAWVAIACILIGSASAIVGALA